MKKNNHLLTGKVRIIGGQWRSRKLPVLNSSGLRPTTHRMRETLFNWLSLSIVGAQCLDCFAGSGILGLEALSRHAASVTLLEIRYRVAQQLQQNLEVLKTTNATVININTLNFLAQSGAGYNIVFVDPPFRKNLLKETLFLLEKNTWLAKNALIYVESEKEHGLPPAPLNWTLHREKITKQVAYRLYFREVKGRYDAALD